MKRELIVQLHTSLEELVKTDEGTGTEFWLARELQALLGYTEWRNFEQVIQRAITACRTAGYEPGDHFVEVNRMVPLGSGAQREVGDWALTRYACYLIAQNGDPAKDAIAFAQTYFAVQTRRQELIEKRLLDVERVGARRKLTASEKELSGLIYERLGDERSFAFIRSKGDQALFGGRTTEGMKERLGIPKNRPLADFLPMITIKAKDFANEITNFSVKRDDLKSEPEISSEHVKSNRDVRRLLGDRGIVPENLPPAEDIKKVQRRLTTEERKLLGEPKALGHGEEEPAD